jgi:ElaB/YqjD/DUF883 family membrane-anchored ribosome-binding protein
MEHTESRPEYQSVAAAGGRTKENQRSGPNPGATISESVARGIDAIGQAGTEVMSPVGSDLLSLRSEFIKLNETVTKFISGAGSEAAKTAREVTSNVAGQVGYAAGDLADKGAEMASAASKQVQSFASELESIARRNPIGTMAGAVAIGVLIGLAGRRK